MTSHFQVVAKLALLLAMCALSFGRWMPQTPASADTPSGVSETRFSKLRRGINASHWFAQAREYTPEHLRTHTTPEDVALIKKLGFDHLRLSVEPAPLFVAADPEKIPAEYLGELDAALDLILASGLAVIVDIHPSDASDFKKKLATDDKHVEAFARFWHALARHLSRRDPERLFLELLNEPVVADGYRWLGIQAKLIAAAREGAPRHTIIAAGHKWSGVGELLFLEPVADPNVVYNFHFYQPMAFTHQGATWAGEGLSQLKAVPYPVTPEAVAALIPASPDAAAQRLLRRYGEERWDSTRIEREVAKVAAWAAKHQVRVTCNEFGVYRKFAPPTARAAWLRDVRTALERHHVGWTMWDYQGGFSVVNKHDGHPTPDPETVAALGLNHLN